MFQQRVDTDFLLMFTFLTVAVEYVATWVCVELQRSWYVQQRPS